MRELIHNPQYKTRFNLLDKIYYINNLTNKYPIENPIEFLKSPIIGTLRIG